MLGRRVQDGDVKGTARRGEALGNLLVTCGQPGESMASVSAGTIGGGAKLRRGKKGLQDNQDK